MEKKQSATTEKQRHLLKQLTDIARAMLHEKMYDFLSIELLAVA